MTIGDTFSAMLPSWGEVLLVGVKCLRLFHFRHISRHFPSTHSTKSHDGVQSNFRGSVGWDELLKTVHIRTSTAVPVEIDDCLKGGFVYVCVLERERQRGCVCVCRTEKPGAAWARNKHRRRVVGSAALALLVPAAPRAQWQYKQERAAQAGPKCQDFDTNWLEESLIEMVVACPNIVTLWQLFLTDPLPWINANCPFENNHSWVLKSLEDLLRVWF